MRLSITVHFDGRVLIPDQLIDLPVGQALVAELEVESAPQLRGSLEERQAAYERLVGRAIPDLNIPDEALRREYLYEDRW